MSQMPYVNQAARDEHDTTGGVDTKKVLIYGWNSNILRKVRLNLDDEGNLYVPGFAISTYDYIAVTYPTTTTELYTYKLGGSSGDTVATITVTYSDASKANITSVEKDAA